MAFNPLVESVPPSGIRKFFDIAGSIANVISLGIGEPDFVTPYHIRSAVMDSLMDGETQYTANYGLIELRREIAGYLSSRFHVTYDPESEVLVTVGASEAIDMVMRGLLAPGDEVILPDPGYVSYQPCVIFAGGTPVAVPTSPENGFVITPEALESAITPRTKAVFLAYPCNPTGAVMPLEQMQKIAEIVTKHDLLLICDDIYIELVYDGFRQESFASLPGMKERTILINGFSKSFAMTGFRVGYICAPDKLLKNPAKIHQYAIMCASRASQVAAIQALKQGRQDNYHDIQVMRDSDDRRRRLMYNALTDMGLACYEPRGAFYLFPSIAGTGMDSDTFCERLLKEQAVVCIPGTAFGACGEGFIRCCYATDIEKMGEAFQRMRVFLGRD
ncbi:MAG: aminotransferase class I/II-fold pyridoxal phosphate-dependent enzyme [Clostridiales bacterium]|nr:aminotransferase class I/II-fold pyridoxal phosphate-dependent enzyme [Clostridiales bacterium]